MVFIKRHHPGKEVRKRHLEFINVNWDLLALEAFKGYMKNGKRGLLTINEADFIDKPRGVEVKFQMGYFEEGSEQFDKVAGSHELEWFRGKKLYDPDLAMCVTFIRGDEGVSSYNVMGFWERTPKALYHRSMMP